MAGEQEPQDIAAELTAMIEASGTPPTAPNGAEPEPDVSGADDLAEFQDAPTDAPDVAALKRQLRGTMTKRTTEIATERKRIAEQSKAYEQAIKEAELFRALKDSADPIKAAEGLFGQRKEGNGGGEYMPPSKVYESLKGEFEPKTFDAIMQLSKAVIEEWAQQKLTPYQQFLHQIASERTTGERSSAVAQYGDDANRWADAAAAYQKKYGVPYEDALHAVSKGHVAISKLRAAVLDKKKRETTQPSVSEQAVQKISLTRDEERARRNKAILEQAQKLGIEQFSRP